MPSDSKQNRGKRSRAGQVDYVALSRDLAHGIESGVYIAQSKKFVYVNPFFEKLTGYSSEELIGRKCLSLVLPKDRAAVRKKAIRNLKSRKGTKPYEYRFIKKTGEVMWVLERISSIEYMGKKATLGSFMDIDERKHLEEALVHSEERYRAILEEMLDPYYEVDLSGNFTFVNNATCQNLGYSSEEIIGKNFHIIVPPEERKTLYRAFNAAYRTGETNKGFAHRIIRKDGTTGFAESSVSFLKNDHGEVIGFRSISRNITERKQLEDAISHSEERYRTIMEQMYDGYYEVDLDGNFTFVNDAVCRNLGYSKDEMVGKSYRYTTPEDDIKNIFVVFNQVYTTGEPHKGFAHKIRRKDGSMIFVESSADLRRNELGEVIGFKSIVRDITERRQLEEELRTSEERYRALFDRSLDLVYIHDLQGNFTDANNMLLKLLGYQREDILSLNITSLIGTDQLSKTVQTLKELKETGAQQGITEYRVKCNDGTFLYLETTESVIYRDGKPYAIQGIARDITDRKQLENALRKSEERYRTILQEMQDSYFEVDLKGNFTFVNESTCRDLGYPREELMGNSFRIIMSKEDAHTVFLAFNTVYKTDEPSKGISSQITRKDGNTAFIEYSISLVKNGSGEAVGFRCVGRDVTERKQMEQKLEAMATHDYLTGLPNRVLLLDRFTVAAALAHRKNARLAVMSLDLDRFKPINDTLGHSAGDQVLKAVGMRLTGIIRASDTVARVGGDEFILVMLETNHINEATAIAQKILDSFKEPFTVNGHELNISTSIGIAVYPEDGQDLETLTKKSDAALYYAKGHGRSQFKFFGDGDVWIDGKHKSV